MPYFNRYSLINAKYIDDVSENTVLYSVIYMMLKIEKGLNPVELIGKIDNYINLSKADGICTGRFHNRPKDDLNGTHEDYMSHDNLTAITCFNHVTSKHLINKCIWQEIDMQWGEYDNLYPYKSYQGKRKEGLPIRLQHPRDLVFYGIAAKSLWAKLCFPILFIAMLVTCMQKYKYRFENGQEIRYHKTDGKILTWLRCKAMGWNTTLWIMTKTMKYFGGFNNWDEVFLLYFGEKDNPINKLVRGK